MAEPLADRKDAAAPVAPEAPDAPAAPDSDGEAGSSAGSGTGAAGAGGEGARASAAKGGAAPKGSALARSRDSAHVHQVRREQASGRCGAFLFSPRVWWRHPLLRVLVTWVILAEDFYIYGEDPVNDSHVTANFPGMGHVLGLFALHTSYNVGYGFLKVFLILLSFILGVVLGRLVLRQVMVRHLRFVAFEGCEGSLVLATISVTAMLFAATMLYNLCLPEGATPLSGSSMEVLQLLGARSDQYRHINHTFQTLSGCVDLLAIVMVTDTVLQDSRRYPKFIPRVKALWVGCGGWARVVVAWLVLIGGSVIIGVLVFSTGKEDFNIRWTTTEWGGTTEISRSMLAACIVFTDLLTVAQDWDFPLFEEPLEVEVPARVMIAGTFWTGLQCNCLGALVRKLPKLPLSDGLRRLLPSAAFFRLSINGKWLTYGPLLGVMVIDLLCAKTQLMYDPVNYGQYAAPPHDRIFVIVDEAYLALAYSNGVIKTDGHHLISYAARWNATTGLPLNPSAATDVELNTRYMGSRVIKWLGLFIALLIVALFLVMLHHANWRLHKEVRRATERASRADEGEERSEEGDKGASEEGAKAGCEVSPAEEGAKAGSAVSLAEVRVDVPTGGNGAASADADAEKPGNERVLEEAEVSPDTDFAGCCRPSQRKTPGGGSAEL